MSISLEYVAKFPGHRTNEISIQVDPNDYFDLYLRSSQGPKTVFRKKLEFLGKHSNKQEPILKYFPSTVKFKNKKKTFLHSIQVEEINQNHRNLPKEPTLSSINKKPADHHSKSSEIRKKSVPRLKKKQDSQNHLKNPRNSKNPSKPSDSDFIRPHIFNPISNFLTEVFPISPNFHQPRPKIFKNHLFNKQTQSRSRFSTPPDSSPARSTSISRHNLRSLICSKIT